MSANRVMRNISRFIEEKLGLKVNMTTVSYTHLIEAFVEKLERSYPSIQYANKLMTHSWGQKVVRFYDLDGNLIEVGTPM